MRIKIGARASTLARWQAHQVARKLQQADSSLQVEFDFSKSFGDQNPDIPLWKMPEQGVFTRDLREKLINESVDLAVHSWKDLPIEDTDPTAVVATLPRADARDLLLVPEANWPRAVAAGRLTILSSSPRRQHNLTADLSPLLPTDLRIDFKPVRGNMLTRIQKAFAEATTAIIVAKAAIDRLLEAEAQAEAEFADGITELIRQSRWMILPLTINPTAAAQGGLAIEAKTSRQDILALLQKINDQESFDLIQAERARFAGYGGGCHQKLGVTFQAIDKGHVEFSRGETPDGQAMHSIDFVATAASARDAHGKLPKLAPEQVFPKDKTEARFFDRIELASARIPHDRPLWVTRANALPEKFEPAEKQRVFTSGLQTWRKLARRGVWVNGCSDAIGERFGAGIDWLDRDRPEAERKFIKLTHAEGKTNAAMDLLATYRLQPREAIADLSGRKAFYWMSYSSFCLAKERFPQILEDDVYHCCGIGHTYELIRLHIPEERLKLFVRYDDFKEAVH